MPPVPKCVMGTSDWVQVCQSLKLNCGCNKHFCALWTIASVDHLLPPLPTFKISNGLLNGASCKHVAYYSPPNVHIYSLLAEQLCCSAMSLLV